MFTVAAQWLIPIEVRVIRCRVEAVEVAIPKESAHPRLILGTPHSSGTTTLQKAPELLLLLFFLFSYFSHDAW
jgi:hypothetical protein